VVVTIKNKRPCLVPVSHPPSRDIFEEENVFPMNARLFPIQYFLPSMHVVVKMNDQNSADNKK